MRPAPSLLVGSARLVALLGWLALTLSGEMSLPWQLASGSAWGLGWILDHRPSIQERLRRLESPAVLLMVAVFFADFFAARSTFFVALAHFLLIFQALKLLGFKSPKDCLQILLFGFFQLLAAATLAVGPWHGFILLAFVPAATACLYWLHLEQEAERWRQPAPAAARAPLQRLGFWIGAGALPVSLVLTIGVFTLFPRLRFNVILPGMAGLHAGYIEQVNLAQAGTIGTNAANVLWIQFPEPSRHTRWDGYLRGSTMETFDGTQWTPAGRSAGSVRTVLPNRERLFVLGPPPLPERTLRQRITLLHSANAVLFTAGRPRQVRAPLPALQTDLSGALRWNPGWHRRLEYEVWAETGPLDDRAPAGPDHLQLPALPLERVAAMARQVAGTGTPLERAQRLERHLQENYRYSLELGERVPEHPLEHFLFERRRGPCGYFASALAVMLRLEGIPCRLVAGYWRGEWNEPARQVLVRERDAHAWVEAYFPGPGWVTFDPSPRETASPAGSRWLLEARQYWDYLGLGWERLVIQYDLRAQRRAFEGLRHSSGRLNRRIQTWVDRRRAAPSPPWKAAGAGLGLVLLPAAAGYFLWRRARRPAPPDPAIAFYFRFLQTMARAGTAKAPAETGLEFALRVARQYPAKAAEAQAVTQRYYRLRFGKASMEDWR